jgi:hypothetical protein
MERSQPKAPATWVVPVSIAFTGLCIFGAGLLIHEPLEKIATKQSQTIIIEHKTGERLEIAPKKR